MPSKPDYTIYADSQREGLWFRDLVPALVEAPIRILGNRTNNPPRIAPLLDYDRPDVIVTDGDEPVLVLEVTSEVPSGHNVGQRVARIVRAAEHHVPVIKYIPFDLMKHGAYAGLCHLNPRVIEAFNRMTEIHGTPVLAINWPADDDWELIRDGTQDEFLGNVLQDYFQSGHDPDCQGMADALRVMKEEVERRLAARPSYAKPPPSVSIMATPEFVALMRDRQASFSPSKAFLERDKTVVYTMKMQPDKCRREDPYTGTQFIYDYQMCRTGEAPSDKKWNLVLDVPLVPRGRWEAANPNDARRKSFLWYQTANGIALSDGFISVIE